MLDALKDFYEAVSIIDLNIFNHNNFFIIKCYRKGFVLSLLSCSKWLLAYVITLILFPKVKPYFKNIIDNEYVLMLALDYYFYCSYFYYCLLIKGLVKLLNILDLEGLILYLDSFLVLLEAYIISVCIFSAIHIVYNYDKWPINIDKSYVFPYLEKGSNYLIKEFPNEKTYQDSKEKIEEL